MGLKRDGCSGYSFSPYRLQSTSKRSTVMCIVRNRRATPLNLHSTLNKSLRVKRWRLWGKSHRGICWETHTFISSEGHNIKLIIAPPNAAEGTIIFSCGRFPSFFPLKNIKHKKIQWSKERERQAKNYEIHGTTVTKGHKKVLKTCNAWVIWEYIPKIRELSKAIPINEDDAPL